MQSVPCGVCFHGHLDIVFLIQSSAAVDFRDHRGKTAMIFASQCGHLDIAQALLDHGVAADAQSMELSTPLHFASVNGHLDIVELLIMRHTERRWGSTLRTLAMSSLRGQAGRKSK
jgi:ankyrin repeat protein